MPQIWWMAPCRIGYNVMPRARPMLPPCRRKHRAMSEKMADDAALLDKKQCDVSALVDGFTVLKKKQCDAATLVDVSSLPKKTPHDVGVLAGG